MKIADLPEDRRRLLALHARSAAVLQLGAARIQELEPLKLAVDDDKEASRLSARQAFLENLWLVRRMADKQAIYETINGLHYAMRPPLEDADRRLVAIERLAKTLGVTAADLDAETKQLIEREETERACVDALAKTFMAKLPSPSPPRLQHRSPGPDGRRSRRRLVNYDDTRLRELVDHMPDAKLLSANERQQLELEMLADLGEHVRLEADLDGPEAPSKTDTPARRASMLLAVCEIAGKYDDDRRAALKRKSATLLAEFPRGAGDGQRYAARSNDLEAELLQPLHEQLARFRSLVVKYAARVAPASTWPPGNSQFDRALALGRTVHVVDADLATARASLGHGRMETTKHEESGR